MAIPVARVYLGMAHAALPALLPTPPNCKMLPLLPMPPCVASATLPKPAAKRISRADSDERWDAHKAKPNPASPASSSASSGPRSADSTRSISAARGSSRKNAATSPPKPGRADSAERWDAHKKAAASSPASLPSSSGTSSLLSSTCPISRASSADRWDVHKKRRSSQAEPQLDDVDSSSTGSNDIDNDEMEEIVYKPPPPRAMYAGPGLAVASPEPTNASDANSVLGSRCVAVGISKASMNV